MALDLNNYKLTFNDDFNSFTSTPQGNSTWQSTLYGARTLSNNGEQQFYSDSTVGVDPFSVANGALTITASPGSNPYGLWYNSGVISTLGSFSQEYGYFEMTAKLPQGAGMWPGFWLLQADHSWPPEVDALEAFGATNSRGEGGADQAHINLITTVPGQSQGNWVTMNGNIYNEFHRYGVDWEPDTITYYIDGQQVGQVATPADMHEPMYMVANLAVGGGWAESAAGETSYMTIDSIRAYSKDPYAPSAAPPTTAPTADTTAPATDGTSTGSATDPTTAAGTGTTLPASTADTATPSTTTGSSAVTLHVSEDAWNGDAQFKVLVDGNQVGGVQTASASHGSGQWQDVTVNGSFDSGPHTVSVQFINDAWGESSSADRNLYVQSVDINGQHISGSTAENDAANGIAGTDPSAAVMAINGSADFKSGAGTSTTSTTSTNSTGSTLVLHVSEDAWGGDAQFKVLVDGQQVGDVQTTTASHGSGQTQDITLTGDFGSLGPDKVSVQFVNDAWGGSASADRNLYVQSLDVNGVHFAGNTAANDAANGIAWTDPSAAVMATNGTATFDVHHSAAPDIWHV